MARAPIRPIIPLRKYQPKNLGQQPGVVMEVLPFWKPPKGLDYLDPLTSVPKEYSPQIKNVWLDRGVQRSRFGTSDVGGQATDLMAVLNFIDGNGVAYLVRFTTTTMESFGGGIWTQVFNAFTGTTDDHFTFTAFNNKLILSNGVDGVYEYDFVSGVLTKLDGAPACRQLSTFDGRVMASNVIDPTTGSRLASRVVWSVKNDSHIWPDSTGFTDVEKQGSGFEDLLNTPGGQIDVQRGIWPITDSIALAVRSKSVWQVTATGNFDAPFSFDRLYDNIGCDAPQSIDTVPGGIVGLFTDDFYVLSNTEIKSIGGRIKDRVIAETTVPDAASGMYDPLTRNYWFAHDDFVYRYSFIDEGWSRHEYPFAIRQMMHTKSSVSGITIDELVGTIDGLTGTIDGLVGTGSVIGNFFATVSGYVIKEDPTVSDDSDGQGGRAESSIEIQTRAAQYSSTLQRNRTLQVQLEYEAVEAQTLTVEYSDDGGVTWEEYSTVTVAPTFGPRVKPFRFTFDSELMLLRLTAPTLGQLKVIGLTAFGQQGAMINL